MINLVEFEDGSPAREFSAADDCLALAHRLHESTNSNRPIGANFYRPDRKSLFVVLGSQVSCMGWFPASYSDGGVGSPSFSADVNIEEPLDYWLCGHHGQIGPENAGEITTMFSSLEQFLRDHQETRTAKLTWLTSPSRFRQRYFS